MKELLQQYANSTNFKFIKHIFNVCKIRDIINYSEIHGIIKLHTNVVLFSIEAEFTEFEDGRNKIYRV